MTTNPKLEVMPLTTELDRASFGGKAAGLARAIKLGFRVPAGFAISVAATQQAPERGEELAAILQAAMTELRPPFAVRSSGLDEDSADASRAGQYRTFLSVKEEGLTSAVLECGADGVAVIVQEMVDATLAGVAFSVDPVTGRTGVVIEAVAGLADHLLEGTESGEHWVAGSAVAETGATALTDAQATEVVRLVESLAEAMGGPVDVEWAFDEEQLWLLQVRPLAAFAKRPAVDLDPRQTWTQDPRFPDPMHRLSFSSWFPIHTAAFSKVFAEFGLPVDTVAHRLVQGRVYSREVPYGGAKRDGVRLPAAVVGLAFRLPPLRSRLAHAKRYDGERGLAELMESWESETGREAIAETRRMRHIDLTRLDGPGLSALVDRVRDHTLQLALIHFRLTLGAVMIPTGRLGLFVEKHLGWDATATIDLVSGFGDASSEAGRQLAGLGAQISPEQRIAIQADRNAVLDVGGIDDFLDRHGHWVNVDLTRPTLAEDLGRLVHLLLAAEADPAEVRARAHEREAEAYAALDPALHGEFQAHLQLARRGRPHQDASEVAVLEAVGLMRPIAREAGRRFVGSGQLPLETDVWHLEVDELQRMLTDRDASITDLVARRSEIAWAATHGGDRRYGPDPVPLPPLRALPRSLQQTVGAILWSAALETPPPVKQSMDGALVGLPGAPGRVEGTVRTVAGEDDFRKVGAGDIVVCRTAVAAWSPMFAIAGGIVTESGGVLSHPATLAREYGVPAVMSVEDAMEHLPEGAWVRVDGGSGTVTVL